MHKLLGAGLALSVSLLVACGGKTTPPPELPAPPRIVSFEASASELQLGEAVTLSFKAENAQEVVLVDQTGAQVELGGDATAGEATVTPSETSFYVLRAAGEGGRDSAFVQVAVGEDLKSVFLIAVPPVVDSGASSQLLWSAHRARSAKLQTSAGQELPLDASKNSGIVEVTPARTVAYTLVSAGVDASKTLTATAEVKVRPVLAGFTATPSAANVGDPITLAWTTRGASEVTLTEATFGELGKFTFPAQTQQVDEGSVAWTIPATLPGGEAVTQGRPLRFTLSVKSINPAVTHTTSLDSYVGDGPKILEFAAPGAVTEQRPLVLSWRTFNATRLQILMDGAVVHELLLASEQDQIAQGGVTLTGPPQDVQLELRVWSHLGGVASEKRSLAIVKAPVVTSFTLPAIISDAGFPAAATWTTEHATAVSLRVKNGPVMYRTEVLARVANGTEDVYPGLKTTFVIEAFNSAGDKATAERTVEVSSAGPLTANPSPSIAGDPVTVEWTLSGVSISQLIGVPGAPLPPNNPATEEFYDLAMHVDARELVFADSDEGVDAVALDAPFLYPLAGTVNSDFHVSTNGFVAFAPTAALKDNKPLDGTAPIPAMVAPFWADLQLGAAGRVLYHVDGQTFPRRLIVQWEQVELVADAQSALTFQVQLFESGEMRFLYKTLTGTGAGGEAASIGYRLNGSLAHESAQPGVPVVTPGDEVLWFTSGALDGQLIYVPGDAGIFTLFGQRPAGGHVVFAARLNPIVPGSVVLSEMMVTPHATATKGQWVELANITGKPVDLSGTELTSASGAVSWTLPEGAEVPPKGFLLVGESTDPAETGGAPVTLTWSGFSLYGAGDDTLLLSANGGGINTTSYLGGDLVIGQSVQAAERAINATGGPVQCTRTQTFGFNGAIGTPGALNEVCFEYSVQSIPGGFEDIRATGTEILVGTDHYAAKGTYALEAPFPYFGQTQTSFNISMCGFISFGPPLTSAYNTTNDTTPGSAAPNGTIAIFWDEIVRNTPNGRVLMERRANYSIISWQDMRIYAQTGSTLDFQIKLFDTGVIEFHYGGIVPYTTIPAGPERASGSSATIWIERLDGSGALPIGINQVGTIQQHTGYRFTPNQ